MKKDDVVYNFDSEWTKKLETELHWRLYWLQQYLIEKYIKKTDCLLEIGVGTKFAANYLKSKGFSITTFDIDKDKKPDIVGNIVEYDWEEEKFNHILAFEILEHIPFEMFEIVMGKFNKICHNNIFLSLPVNEKTIFEIDYKLPKLKKKTFSINIKKRKITTKTHFWEVGYENYTKNCVEDVFEKNGFIIIEVVRKFNFLFYVLKKGSESDI